MLSIGFMASGLEGQKVDLDRWSAGNCVKSINSVVLAPPAPAPCFHCNFAAFEFGSAKKHATDLTGPYQIHLFGVIA